MNGKDLLDSMDLIDMELVEKAEYPENNIYNNKDLFYIKHRKKYICIKVLPAAAAVFAICFGIVHLKNIKHEKSNYLIDNNPVAEETTVSSFTETTSSDNSIKSDSYISTSETAKTENRESIVQNADSDVTPENCVTEIPVKKTESYVNTGKSIDTAISEGKKEKFPDETIPNPVLTDTEPEIKEEIDMKIQYKKAIAFLTALAAANPGGILSFANADDNYTSDEAALISISENTEKYDFNADGRFDRSDLYDLYLYINEKESLSEEKINKVRINADVNSDGKTDVQDIYLLDGYGIYNCYEEYKALKTNSQYDEFENSLYGSEKVKNEFCDLLKMLDRSSTYEFSMKYSAPKYKKLCEDITSGKFDPDINMDGTEDLKDLYDFWIYQEYKNLLEAENLNYELSVPTGIPSETRARMLAKCKPFFEKKEDFYYYNKGIIAVLARYYITHSDIKPEYLTEEFYDNIYNLDHQRVDTLTDSESFIAYLADWLKVVSIKDYDALKIQTVDDIVYNIFADHACVIKNNSDREKIVIPSEVEGVPVTGIGEYVFDGNEIVKTVELPDTLSEIGLGAFMFCNNLNSITLPDSICKIDRYAFDGCEKLNIKKLPGSLKTICMSTFSNCSTITEIEIPDGVEVIENSAFRECTSLKKVVLPESIKTIDNLAFNLCTSLDEINFPEGLETINGSAFMNCNLKSIIFPSGLKTIMQSAFRNNYNLESVVFSEGIEKIGNCAFYNCPKVKSVTIPGSIKECSYSGFGAYDSQDRDTYLVSSDFVMKIYSGSPAMEEIKGLGLNYEIINERPAEEIKEYYKPKASEIPCGDINLSGSTDLTDLSMLSVALLSKNTLNEQQTAIADIDANGEVDIADLAYLKQYVCKDLSVMDMFENNK